MRSFAVAVAALLLALLLAPSAQAHPADAWASASAPTARAAAAPPEIANPGPCTSAAAVGMPEGEGHDHQDVAQHKGLECRMKQVAFTSLKEELADRPDVVLGEMDVKADIAAISVIYPEGGAVFFDVSNPAQPKFLSWARSVGNCEGAAIANNCGAFVDLSADGKTAVIGVQNLTVVPQPTFEPGTAPVANPGVQVIDLSNPREPRAGETYTVASQGGVHTSRTFKAEDGEYVYSIANGVGVDIARFVDLPTGGRKLVNVAKVDAPNIHDTFTQKDPIDGKTYLYIADGYGSGFQVYDVSDPAAPAKVAEWDLTPQCTRDWYAHTIDVTHRGNKRYVTLPAELFNGGTQPAAQQKECGMVTGNGDKAGPLWIVDATDFSSLARIGAPDAEIKAKSEASLVSTWTNPAGRAAGPLTFSPHNQQIVGDKIYLSDYHGGVFVLDASGAFAGRVGERPRELAHLVPSGEASNEAARPMFMPPPGGASPRVRGRSSIWDMVFYKGHVLAADQVGGFYSLQYEGDAADTMDRPPPPTVATPDAPAGGAPGGGTPGAGTPGTPGATTPPAAPGASPCVDRSTPRSRFPRRGGLRITRRGLDLRGTARDTGCGGRVSRVLVAVARVSGKRCRFLTAGGKLGRARACSRPTYVPVKGTARWSLRLRAKLPRGRYQARPRAIDAAGNVESRTPRFTRVR